MRRSAIDYCLAAGVLAGACWLAWLGWRPLAAWALVTLTAGVPISAALPERSAGRILAGVALVVAGAVWMGVSSLASPGVCVGVAECEVSR